MPFLGPDCTEFEIANNNRDEYRCQDIGRSLLLLFSCRHSSCLQCSLFCAILQFGFDENNQDDAKFFIESDDVAAAIQAADNRIPSHSGGKLKIFVNQRVGCVFGGSIEL